MSGYGKYFGALMQSQLNLCFCTHLDYGIAVASVLEFIFCENEEMRNSAQLVIKIQQPLSLTCT